MFGGQKRDQLVYHIFRHSLCGQESAGLEEKVTLQCKIKMLPETIQYIVSLPILPEKHSQKESHVLVTREVQLLMNLCYLD